MLSPEQARQERARLHEELQRIEAQDTQRYAIIGRVAAQQAETDEAFAKQLRGLLELGSRVTRRPSWTSKFS